VLVRCSDHGEMGLAHGGLRQKMFNAYEETINVPLVISNPVLFPRPARTSSLVSLVDLLPTVLTLCGLPDRDDVPALRGRDLSPLLAHHAEPVGERLRRSPVGLGTVLEHPRPAKSVRDDIHFTYDDHQAGTATQEAPGQPNRIRAIRTTTIKYAIYYDPAGRVSPEYELYDLERDPYQLRSLDESDRYAPVLRDLRARLRRLRNCAGETCRLQPALRLRLRSAGRVLSQGACPRGDLRVRIGGPDRGRVVRALVHAGRRRIARVAAPPISHRIDRPRVRTGRSYRLRVTAELRDGRVLTLDRRLRACR
jgi:arylsulfatase A-like enzyme